MTNAATFSIRIISGAIPQGLYELRRDIYFIEKKFLKEESLLCEEDYGGQHICIYHDDKLVASMFGIDAQQSPFPVYTGIPLSDLKNCYYSTRGMIHRDYRSRHNLWALITYLTFLTGIKLEFVNNVSLFENKAFVELIMDVEWMANIPQVLVEGIDRQYEVIPAIVNLRYGCESAWEQLDQDIRQLLASQDLLIPKQSLAELI